MLADKKKLAVVGVLGVVVLGVGVFEFTGSSAPEPSKAKADKTHSSAAKSASSSSPDAAANPEKASTPEAATGVDGKDGKSLKEDGKASADPKDPKAKTVATVIAEPDVQERDPFDGSRWIQVDKPAVSNPIPAPKPLSGGPLGKMPPFNPGPIEGIPSIPGGRGGMLQQPGLPQAAEPRFDYGVSGVVAGDRPMAVFVDSRGNQRLIQLGGSLDNDTKVTSISRGKVSVRWHGKNLTLTVGANNPTEKRSDEK